MTASSHHALSPVDDAQTGTLIRRARELALTAEEDARHQVDVLLFRLGNERYAVELGPLRSVLRQSGLTAVPCAPPHIAGIVNVRGEIVTVIDLGAVLALSGEQAPSAERWVVLVQLAQGRVGLAVDEVLDMSRISSDTLDRSISGRDFVVGIHDGTTILLDLALLLTPERLDVFEHVT